MERFKNLKPEDLVINSWRGVRQSGWGISVDRGIQIVHRPTGAMVQVDTDRSQHKNKVIALEMLDKKVGEILAAPSAASAAPAEPVAYLRFRAAQQWSGNGNHDIEHSEWLETCHAHEIGDDKLPAFPVYAEPRAIAATSPKCDLTDEQIDTCMATALPNTRPSKGFRNFARAVASLCNGVPETMGDCAKCKGIGAAYKIGKEAASGPNAALVEALKEFISDVTERFDMDSPSTNPGIKSCVEQGRAALAAAGIKEQP